MDPVTNPFSPGAGSPPPELAGRDEILEQARITLLRIKGGKNEQSLMPVGLRGVGKTVLLNRINELASSEGYLTVMIEAAEGRRLAELLIPPLRSVLYKLDSIHGLSEKVKRSLRVLASFVKGAKLKYADAEFSMNIDAEPGAADSGDLENDLGELFLAIAEAAKDRATPVAVIVDEIQYLDEQEMSALIMALHKIAQRQLPLVLVGAGLPQLVALAGKSKSYAERLFRYPLVGPLTASDAKEAIRAPAAQQGVQFTEAALEEIAAVTMGYPYFLQEWGYAAWNLAKQSPIDLATVQTASKVAVKKLDESFFRVRFDRLTPREREYLRALAHLGPGSQRSGDIADCLGVKSQSIAPLRSGLIKKGMIYSPAHGDTTFTVPLFTEIYASHDARLETSRRSLNQMSSPDDHLYLDAAAERQRKTTTRLTRSTTRLHYTFALHACTTRLQRQTLSGSTAFDLPASAQSLFLQVEDVSAGLFYRLPSLSRSTATHDSN